MYRIEFSVQCRGPDDEDYTEIGFGSSCGAGNVDQAAFEVETLVQRRQWETSGDMPDPATIPLDG